MIPINETNPRESIWQFYSEWIGHIINEDDDRAFAMLDDPSPSGTVWNMASFMSILEVITGKRFDRHMLDASTLSDARYDFFAGTGPVTTKYADYWVLVDLPLGAGFGGQVLVPLVFRKRGGEYAVTLDDQEHFQVL